MTEAMAEQRFDVALPDGATLSAWVDGDGPTTFLLISGLGGSASFWAETSRVLSRQFRVVRFDQRGIGKSTRGDAACSIARLAQDCLAVLDAIDVDRCVVLGHSTGGCIAQVLATIAPQRTSALILSASWLAPSRYMDALFRARRDILETLPETYAASAALLSYPPAWLEANWPVFERSVAAAPGSDSARRVVRERIDALLAFDGSADAAALGLPVLVLGARDDAIVPSFLQQGLDKALPNSRLVLFEDGGHFYPVSRPDAFTAEVVDWIEGL